MITEMQMRKMAEKAVKNAPNQDWNRSFALDGNLEEHPVENIGISGKTVNHGNATVAFYRWDSALYSFVGFTIAVMEVQGKIIYETNPVINELRKDEMKNTAWKLCCHFCPKCGAVDSILRRRGRSGREFVVFHYSCPECDYEETDVLD